MKKTLARVSSVAMAAMLAAGTMSGAGIFTPAVALAEAAVETKLTITDNELTKYFNTVSESTVSVHDPSIIEGTDKNGEKCYFIFGSHMAWAKSYDLENWTTFTNNINAGNLSNVLPENVINWSAKGGTQGSATGAYDPSGNMWAPDVIYNEELGKWCMYMSVNGDYWYSSIIMLTADNLEGNWTYEDTIVYSGITNADEAALTDYTKATDSEFDEAAVERYNRKRNKNITYSMNAIDPCVFYDENGTLWMSYGSWFGGIYMLKLDEKTGLRDYTKKYELADNTSDPYMGIKLAGGNNSTGEASYIQYIDGYYYLFVTYGGLTANGGYNMRVFRSQSAEGPYTDVSGDSAKYSNTVASANTGNGTRLMTYYKWSWWQNAQVAQGHNSAFTDDDGNSYLIYHTRTDDGTEGHYVRVHQLFTTQNGYLVAAPFEYSATDNTDIDKSDVTGTYEVIMHTNTDYANLKSVESSQMTLNSDGTVTGAYSGTWSLETVDGKDYITFVINGVTYEGVMVNQTLEGTDVESLCFTSVGSNDITFWGAQQPDDATAVAATATYKNTTEGLPAVTFGSLELGTEGYFGTEVNWKSSDESIIADDGTFTQPEEDTDVVLTMEITKGEYVYEKTYTVTAKAALDETDDRYLVAEYLTGEEVDLSDGSSYSFANPFNSSVTPNIDISNGVSVKFDTELKSTTPLALSNLIAFTGGGKLYFTGGSYLGYNAVGGYFDANLKNYGLATDYIGTYNKVTVEIRLTKDGYAVYVDDKLAYTNDTLAEGTVAGTLTDYSNVLEWLNDTADTLSLGTGNWWSDVVYKGTVSNIKFYAEPVEKKEADTSSYTYYENYDNMTDTEILAAWPAVNLSGAVAKSDEHGKYFSYVHPGNTNTRGIATTFPEEANVGEGYSVSVDVQLKAASGSNAQSSEFTITSTDKAYNSNVINNGLATGYIVDLKAATNTTTWTVNGTDTVDIPADTWVNIRADILAEGKVKVTITNGDNVLYEGTTSYNGNGILGGIYLLDGRYTAAMAVDNIKVWDTSVNPEASADDSNSEESYEVVVEGQQFADSNGWWAAFSDYYTMKDGDEITFTIEDTSTGTDNWDNWVLVCANAERGAEGYAESVVVRADNFGWGTDYNGANNSIDWSDWSEFCSSHQNGVETKVKVARNGADFTMTAVTTDKAGKVYNYSTMWTVTTALADEMKIFFTGEDCELTMKSVEYKDEYTFANYSGWWSEFSNDYTIKSGEKLKFTLEDVSNGAFNWNNWVLVCANGARGSEGYAESVVVRADNFGWGTDYNGGNNSIDWTDWTEFCSSHAAGATVEIEVSRYGADYTMTAVTTDIDGKVYNYSTSWTVTSALEDEMTLFFTGEGCKLTMKSVERTVFDKEVINVSVIEKMSLSVSDAVTSIAEGYTEAPTAKYVIKNDGNKDITNIKAQLSDGTNFTIVSGAEKESLAAGETLEITVKAADGLEGKAAAYTDKLIISADNADTQKVKISLSVIAEAEEGVKNPAPKPQEPESGEKESSKTEEESGEEESSKTEEEGGEEESSKTEEESSEEESSKTEEESSEEESSKTEEESTEESSEEESSDKEEETTVPVEEETTPSKEDVEIVDVQTEQYTEQYTEIVTEEYTETHTETYTEEVTSVDTENLVGTEWWIANQTGKNYELSGDGEIELTVKCDEDLNGYAAFNVEIFDNAGKFITTGSDLNAWYFGAEGDAIKGIAAVLGSEVKTGDTYTIKVKRTGKNFVITYLKADGTKLVEFTAENTNLEDAINVHIIAQVGTYTISKTDVTTVEKTREVTETKTREVTVTRTKTITVVTTTYNDGSKIIVTTVTDEDGKVLSKKTESIDAEGNVDVEEETPEVPTEDDDTTEESSGNAEEITETPSGDAGEETTGAPSGNTGEETTESPSGDAGEETTESPSGDAGEETTESPLGDAGEETTNTPSGDADEETADTPSETTEKETTETSSEAEKKETSNVSTEDIVKLENEEIPLADGNSDAEQLKNDGKTTDTNTPKTGDSKTGIFGIMAAVAGCAAALLKKKRETEEN